MIRAVQVPHPGTSYNPSLADHQSLLQDVVEREKKIIKKNEHLNRVTTAMFNKVSAVDRDIALLKEQRSGMDENDEDAETATGNDENQNELIALNTPVVIKKKSQKARRKQKEQRELKQELLKKKLEKKKIGDIHR